MSLLHPSSLTPSHIPTKRKRLRKKRIGGLRKKLRTHIESVEEFNPEARDAQSAEQERRKRLMLQQQMSMQSGGSDGASLYPLEGGVPGGVGGVMRDVGRGGMRCAVRGPSSPDTVQAESLPGGGLSSGDFSQSTDAIVIHSGSSDSDAASGTAVVNYLQGLLHSAFPTFPSVSPDTRTSQVVGIPPARQLPKKYNMMDSQGQQLMDGRVLINQGHPFTEVDVFIAPQIGRVAKPHQVCVSNFFISTVIMWLELDVVTISL